MKIIMLDFPEEIINLLINFTYSNDNPIAAISLCLISKNIDFRTSKTRKYIVNQHYKEKIHKPYYDLHVLKELKTMTEDIPFTTIHENTFGLYSKVYDYDNRHNRYVLVRWKQKKYNFDMIRLQFSLSLPITNRWYLLVNLNEKIERYHNYAFANCYFAIGFENALSASNYKYQCSKQTYDNV